METLQWMRMETGGKNNGMQVADDSIANIASIAGKLDSGINVRDSVSYTYILVASTDITLQYLMTSTNLESGTITVTILALN